MNTFFEPPDTTIERRYNLRLAILALSLLALTLAVALLVPRRGDVQLGGEPQGSRVPRTAQIIVRFERDVDRRSAERALLVAPLVRGTLNWPDDRTLVLTPSQALQPSTLYRVTVLPLLQDQRGRTNQSPQSWSFVTGP